MVLSLKVSSHLYQMPLVVVDSDEKLLNLPKLGLQLVLQFLLHGVHVLL